MDLNFSFFKQLTVKQLSEKLAHRHILTALGATVLTIFFWAFRDFSQWVHYGTGGTPPTLRGWLRVTRLRMGRILKHAAGDDLRDPSPIPRTGTAFIKDPLARRAGGHPGLLPRTLPQRQWPEPLPDAAKTKLFAMCGDYAKKYPNLLNFGPSKTEGGTTDAVYARPEVPTCNHDAKQVGYELFHVHPLDNSLHVQLSPLDARTVIEAEWGQRFPVPELAPPGWIMVYAPRNEDEVDLIAQVMDASVKWITGVRDL